MNSAFLMEKANIGNGVNEDALEGFRSAAANGQTRLSLDYLVHIINVLIEKVSLLESKLAEHDTEQKTTKQTKNVKVATEEV